MEAWKWFVLLAVALVLLYLWVRDRSRGRGGSQRGGAYGGSATGPTLYYRPSCPHCVSFMPTWDSVSGRIGGRKVNCDATPGQCAGISGVPTIKGADGRAYGGPRTADALVAWASGSA